MKRLFKLLCAFLSLCIAISPVAAAPGDVETGFNANVSFIVYSTAVQADGKILIGGNFTTVGGAPRNRIARLNADGTLDSVFNPNANNTVWSTVVQADGKILIGGDFTTVGGVTRNRIARLNADGTLDSGFNPDANDKVSSVAVQTDGKVLIGGIFTTVGGAGRNKIARLNANGTLDSGFNLDADDAVTCAVVQADGKILLGGYFITLGVVTRHKIARLNADGTLDTTFNPDAGTSGNNVFSMALQADGKILIAGSFTAVGGTTRNRIARVDANGALDSGFNPDVNNEIYSTVVQADGKILIGGQFSTVGGVTRNNIARLNADGTLDAGFNPNAGNVVYNTALQADGKILIGGFFTTMGGVARNRFARLVNDAATETLNVASADRIEWLRGGSSPETLRVTFDLSTDGGINYTLLGLGTRISGGWELTGLNLPASRLVRARALVTGGQYSGSSGLVESVASVGPPFITGQPQSLTVAVGANAGFSVTAIGTPPLTYQWRKGGVDISLATNATLNLSNVQVADIGSYDLVVTNGLGSVTSSAATLTVSPPTITDIANLTINEDATTGALPFTIGDLETPAANLTLSKSSSNQTLVPAANIVLGGSGASRSVTVTPAPNRSGSTIITITVTDEQGQTASDSFTLTVNDVNDAPAGADKTITMNEGASYTFTATDFGFSDPNDSPPNSFLWVKITTLPLSGLLTLNGTPVNAGDTISPVPAGEVWTARAFVRGWGSIASSADGTKLVAADSSGTSQLFASVDSGVTWSTLATDYQIWTSIASSSDGTKLVAAADGGQIYTSSNSGVSWTAHETNRSWTAVASSVDGTKLVAVVGNGQIYTSTDSGANWLARATNRLWSSVASSADGAKLVAVVNSGQIYTSTDSGANWTARASNRVWVSVASSSDGTKLAAVVNFGGQIYTSTDSGVTWTARSGAGSASWQSIASSADGSKLVATAAASNVFTSSDSGISWTAHDSNQQWTAVASSADGKRLVAGVSNGLIYTSRGSDDMVFTPAVNGNGSPYASFTFQVQDNGGTANGGVNLDPSPNTVAINVTSVNNAPAGTNNTVTTLEDTSYTFSTVDFGFTDPNDSPPNNFSRVKITTLPSAGTLTLGGNAVNAGDFVPPNAVAAGTFWTARESNRNWFKVASSADGSKLVAADYGEGLYTSTDSGVTWTARESGRNWYSVASSSDGTKLVAVVNNNNIYTSTDSGVNWTARDSYRAWYSVASSADGSKLVAVVQHDPGGQIYTSTDSGVSWTARENSRDWRSVASSADGSKLVAAEYGGQIYTSTDSGVTWTARESSRQWWSLASSSDGTKLVAGVNGGQIYTSTDSGVSWMARGSSRSWQSVASSSDGSKLVAAAFLDQVYTSTDSGVSWTASGIGGQSHGVASSADGSKLVAADYGGQLYTSTASAPLVFTPAPNANGTPYTSFTFQVEDDGGTANGGVNLDQSPNTLTINVTPVNNDPGEVDLNFNPDANSIVWSTAVQPDGKILLGGNFGVVAGVARYAVARLNADGTLDAGFNPNVGTVNNGVYSVAVQADGKILIGGDFTFGGDFHNDIKRLNADGTLDAAFSPNVYGPVYSTALQADGKILIGGLFSSVDGVPRNRIARLNADGTLDSGFNPNVGTSNNGIYSMTVQADGKILIGGDFTTVGGVARNYVARLNADGTLDTGFNPNANGTVQTLGLQADGKILIAGQFTTLGAVSRNRIARLNADGTLDAGFNPDANSTVQSMGLQADGKLLLGGSFTAVGGVARNRIARLNMDGTLDTGFNPDANGIVQSTAVQADGNILLGGSFTAVGGVSRNHIVRLANGPATQSLTAASASRIAWLRGGSSPEAQMVTFDLSTDGGTNYGMLGAGTRISGGWELAGLSLPASGQIRARARTTGAQYNGSSGLVETLASYGALPIPEIAVSGNSVNITDGDATPSTADHTDFGPQNVTSGTVVRTFTIQNTGTGALALGTVTVGGADAADFTVTAPPPASVAPGGSTTFQVTFDPSALGIRSATLSFATNDFDENPFIFSIRGTGVYTDANLSSLVPSAGTLSPAFVSGATIYTLNVDFNSYSLAVTPTVSQANATVTVNGSAVTSGSASGNIPLNVGANTITVVANAQDGTTTKTYTITVTRAAALPGDVSQGFNPDANNGVQSMAVQADGKILIGGYFGTLGGVARNCIARLNADGTLDGGFNPYVSSDVRSIAVQADGKIVIGGFFTTVNGVTRNRLARLNPDGTLDNGFNPDADNNVLSTAVQPDGKIVIGGFFATVGGAPHNCIARLNADGTPDSGFNPDASDGVMCMALQADGKIVIGGWFTMVGGGTRNYLARLNANGTLDTSFNAAVNGTYVYSTAVQSDGKIVIGGFFTTVGGVGRDNLARLNADGTLDAGFNPSSSGWISGTAFQADGKIIVAGEFTSIGGVNRNRIVRLNANGTVDAGFNPNVDNNVLATAVQADGEIVIGGYFTTVGGVPRNNLARLENDPATQSLTVPSAGRIQWLRGGTSPEAQTVVFELSTDGGTNYTTLGAGTRVTGGWELTGLGLPAAGQIRARARTTGGFGNSSSGLVEAGTPFSGLVPVIAVEQPAGTGLTDGSSTIAFGTLNIGTASAAKTFTIRNTGIGGLTISGVTKSGAGAADFAVNTSGMAGNIPPGGSTSFTVAFTPSSLGNRSAALQIGSNITGSTNPFDISLTGSGVQGTLAATFTTSSDVPLTTTGVTVTGSTVTLALNYVPAVGTTLTVVNNTGLGFINGTFSNLTHGQLVPLTYNGVTYNFVANYYGGTGNDLVLQWAYNRLVSWGSNSNGQLGNNSTTNSSVPVSVIGPGVLAGKTIIAFAEGWNHNLILHSDGTMAAWGSNSNGQLGNNSTTDSSVPVAVNQSGVLATKTVVAVAAGQACSFALCSDGTLAAWGLNTDGELGNGSNADSHLPVPVNTSGILAGRTVSSIVAGGGHSLALCSDGTLVAWGFNAYGDLGNNSTAASNVPVAVDVSSGNGSALFGKTVVAIAAGANHNIAICADGTASAWGYNGFGGLGNNSTVNSSVPVAVNMSGTLAGKTANSASAGADHTFLLSGDGTLAAWGYNLFGQLGNNSSTDSHVPLLVYVSGVLSGKTVTSISAGASHNLALCADGTLVSWGRNVEGQLGNNSNTQSNSPVTVNSSSLLNGERIVSAVSCENANHNLALIAVPHPQIIVQQPAGTNLTSGSSTVNYAFRGTSQTFTIQNTGSNTLTGVAVSFSGTNASDFNLSAAPATTVAPGASTTFTVAFAPTGGNSRSATLQIASNDYTTNPFNVALTGNGSTTLAASYGSGSDVPITNNGFSPAGSAVNFTLTFAPAAGTVLTVVNNTSGNPINGTFSNLAQGQAVALTFGGNTYNFVADYFGGTGNDLVLLLQGPGALDFSFGARGRTTIGFIGGYSYGSSYALQADGKILGAGFVSNGTNYDIGVIRCNSDGTLDTSFNDTGKVIIPTATTNSSLFPSITQQPDGKIVIAGKTGTGSGTDFLAARLNANGTLDTSFNGTGRVVTDITGDEDYANAVVVQPDGKIVVAGTAKTGAGYDFALVRYNSNGSLDTSFNGTGKVTTDFGSADYGWGLALQNDGKIIVSGYSGPYPSTNVALARYNTDGSLDTSFNGTGKVITDFGSDDYAYGVAVQPDGKIVVGGQSNTGGSGNAILSRYNSNGSLDVNFGNQGKVVLSPSPGSAGSVGRNVALQSDGKIVLAGYSSPGSVGTVDNFSVWRVLASGVLDPSFHGTGRSDIAISGGTDLGLGVLLQTDGKIVVAGQPDYYGTGGFAMVRFLGDTSHDVTFASEATVPLNANGFTATGQTVNITLGFAPVTGTTLTLVNNTGSTPISGTFTNLANGALVPLTYGGTTYQFKAYYTAGDGNDLVLILEGPGALDFTFNGRGINTTPIGNGDDVGYATAIQRDGKILVAGHSSNDFALARYTTNGTLDSTFNGTGKVATDLGGEDIISSIVVQNDGRIVATGSSGNGDHDFAVVRYNADGTLDTSFNSTGKVTTPIGVGDDVGVSSVVQNDGKIVVAGYSFNGSNYDFGLVRYNLNGTLDTNFNGTGKVITDFGGNDFPNSMVLQADGKLVVAGYTSIGNNDFAVARYNTNGTLDTSFNGTGRITVAFGSGSDLGQSVALQADGKIVVAGVSNTNGSYDFALIRFSADGSLDTSFNGTGKVTTSIGSATDSGRSVAVLSDGKIVVAGYAFNGTKNNFALARYNTNGTLDTSFCGSGKVITAVGSGDDTIYGMAIQNDGRIVVTGQSFNGSNYDFAIARYLVETSHDVNFSSTANAPMTANGFTASGHTVNITLSFAPVPGTNLTMVNNTGLSPIGGTFTNLAQGQAVSLSFGGNTYDFIANYFGGDGNDLVLQWAYTKLTAWGDNSGGELGINSTAVQMNVPTQVVATTPIYTKTITRMAAGNAHSLAVCSDGTVAAWGSSANGQLGNGGTVSSAVPVAVTMSGVLNGKKVIAVSAGWQHSLALCSDGTLAAWGDGSFGQLGNNSTLDSVVPVLVSTAGVLNGKRVIAISAGYTHSAALCSDGTVVTWGDNPAGELGNGNNVRSLVPVPVVTTGVLSGKTVKSIAAGYSHTLALLTDGTMVAWGANSSKQLGNNSTVNSNVPVAVNTAGLLNGKQVTDIAAGGHQCVALCSDGTLAAWGSNDHGQLGTGSATTTFGTPQAVDLSGALLGKSITGIQMGYRHALAVSSDGSMTAWGWGASGQLGNNGISDSLVPVAVDSSILGGSDRFTAAAGGGYANHALAIVATTTPAPMIQVEHPAGTVLVDGSGTQSFGGTLVGSTKSKTFTVRNTGTLTLSILSANVTGLGSSHYAITTQPAVSLAPGDATSVVLSFTPVNNGAKPAALRITSNVAGALNPFDINVDGTGDPELSITWLTGNEVPAQAAVFDASGKEVIFNLGFAPPTGSTLMVVNNTGTGFIEGYFDSSQYGQLVHGQEVELDFNGTTYTFVANYFGGDGNDLVLQWAGTRLLAWGAGTSGILGNGLTSNSNVPVVVNMTTPALAGKRVLAVTCGASHTVALCNDGTLASWGSNANGQLGNNNATGNSSTPVAVLTTSGALFGRTVVGIAAGADFTLAMCSDGTVASWGKNNVGQLGNGGMPTNSAVPVLVTMNGALSGKIVTAIAAGGTHALVRCSDGSVFAWGANGSGQLGDNNAPNDSGVPVAVFASGVLSGKQIARISAGYTHSHVTCTNGSQAAWGDNAYGQLGDGTTTASPVPVLVDMNGVLSGRITNQEGAGQFHSALLSTDGTLAAWGRNNNAQLGISTATLFSLSPGAVPQTGALAGKAAAILATGRQHHVALLTDGTLAAWGLGGSGQLGHGASPLNSATPVAVSTAALSAGETVMRVTSGTGALHSVSMIAKPVTAPGSAPVVSTSAATSIDKIVATLNGLVNPNGLATDARFEYGLTTGYGTQTVVQSLGNGSSSLPVTHNLTGLQANTTYHYRITATNSGGTAMGSDLTFNTLADPPSVVTNSATSIANNSATLNGSVNPNTRITTVFFRISTDPAFPPGSTNTTATQNIPAGTSLVNVNALVSGLLHGTTYYYRIVAQNAGGGAEELTSQSFTTTSVGIATAPPTVSGVGVINVTTTGARLQGSVNPNGGITNAFFEYGAAPGFGTNSTNLGAGSGTTPQSVFFDISSLLPGTLYQFRLIAENNFTNGSPGAGTTTGSTITFTTNFLPPTVTTGSSSALTTTSARITGTVRARNASSDVFFDYGTDGVNFPNSVNATPAFVAGDVDTAVSADLTNLFQGVTYYYRLRAVSVGGTSTGSAASLQVAILSGFLQQVPAAPPAANGALMVNVTPGSVGGGWRFVGEQLWRAPGTTVGALTTGDRYIEFQPVAGYHQPETELVSIISGGVATVFLGEYAEVSGTGGTGAMIVLLKPDSLTAPGLPVADRAQWRLLGEDDTQWRESGVLLGGLRPGTYLVESKALAGRTTPRPLSVSVGDGQTVTGVATYYLADALTGTGPSLLSFGTVTGSPALPYQYVGQFRTDAGSGTGFVVKARVVATAAHMVFDDGTLASATGSQWVFERDRVSFEPVPQIPRGFYMFSGYSAQRQAENTPGTSSPASQTLDAAAVYFLEDAGRGGFGGYLASDSTPNEWLTSSALKTLVGYPIDGVTAADQGRMHATPPANVTFSHSFGRSYTTSGIRSTGGNSGGPLCVQYQNGSYYPAAIYLGGTGQTVVRVIDSDVIDMFNRAEISGNGGGNNTGGGITHTNSGVQTRTDAKGTIKVIILPAGAATTARWKLSGTTSVLRLTGTTYSTAAGGYYLYFNEVPGYASPDTTAVTVAANTLDEYTAYYKLPQTISFSPPTSTTLADPPLAMGATATSGLAVTLTLVSGPATLSGNVLTPTGNGTVTVTASQAGDVTTWAAAANVQRTIQITADNLGAWNGRNFTAPELGNPAISGPLADPNGNGVCNLLEFAFNMNPRNPSYQQLVHFTGTAGMPYLSRDGSGNLVIEYIRRKSAGTPGISYAVEFASSLTGPWTVQSADSAISIDATFERVTVTDTIANTQRFGRVKVTQP